MRYNIRIEAYQVLDGAQVTMWVRGQDSLLDPEPKLVLRRMFTAMDLDGSAPDNWARDVLVSVLEHL